MLRSEIVKLPGGRQVKVHRSGNGPVLVWLHGPHGVRQHDPMIAKLAERYSVIAPLSPGFSDLAELDEIGSVHDLSLYHDDLFDAVEPDLTLEGLRIIHELNRE